MNKVILIGRLCADPELRQTQSQIACCRFRIAVNRPKRKDAEQEADFINCTAWRQTAEFVARYFEKGSKIVVEGSMRNNDWEDNNGVKHYSMEVLVDSVEFGESKAAAQSAPQQYQQAAPAPAPARQQRPQPAPQPQRPAEKPAETIPLNLDEFEEILSDGEVPF